MNLTEIITKVLSNSQIRLVLTEDGFDWIPNNFTGSTQFFAIADDAALQHIAGDAEPLEVVEFIADYITDNIRQWICDAIDQEEDAQEPSEERLAFFNALLEKF